MSGAEGASADLHAANRVERETIVTTPGSETDVDAADHARTRGVAPPGSLDPTGGDPRPQPVEGAHDVGPCDGSVPCEHILEVRRTTASSNEFISEELSHLFAALLERDAQIRALTSEVEELKQLQAETSVQLAALEHRYKVLAVHVHRLETAATPAAAGSRTPNR